MIERDTVVLEARGWLGTPYRHQGRLKGLAVDCLGLVTEVGRSIGAGTYDRLDYGRLPNPRRMLAELRDHLEVIAVCDACPGDVLHISWREHPMHLAIRTPDGMIHAYAQVGEVVEHPIDVEWRGRIRFAYRYPGVG